MQCDSKFFLFSFIAISNESHYFPTFSNLSTHGAATMMGRHNGVVARLKIITPSAIGVHCDAHRLNLASLRFILTTVLLEQLD